MRRGRHGIALVIVLLTIVALGILVAGAFFGASQEARIGREALRHEQVLLAAENALAAALLHWDGDSAAALRAGTIRSLPSSQQGEIGVEVALLRLSLIDYLILAEATSPVAASGAARRRIGMSLQLVMPDLGEQAALELHWPVGGDADFVVGDGARISGADHSPPGWPECGAAGAGLAGIMTADSSAIAPECGAVGCLAGSPPALADPAAGAGSAGAFGDAVWSALTARADFRLPGGGDVGTADRPVRPAVSAGKCARLVEHNWGDPARLTDCATFFPTVHVLGDLQFSAGTGQGVLLVEGNMTITGGASFFGLVLVRGSLRSTDGGGQLSGVVQVGGQTDSSTFLGPGTSVTYSRCALLAALAASAKPQPITRAWVEAY